MSVGGCIAIIFEALQETQDVPLSFICVLSFVENQLLFLLFYRMTYYSYVIAKN